MLVQHAVFSIAFRFVSETHPVCSIRTVNRQQCNPA